MELRKLDKSILKLWYIRAAIGSIALIGVFTGGFALILGIITCVVLPIYGGFSAYSGV